MLLSYQANDIRKMKNTQHLLEKTKNELKLRNYSQKTIRSYLYYLSNYLKNINNYKTLDEDLIRNYLLKKKDGGWSPESTNLCLNSIKFFYREIIETPQKINIKFAKKSKKLPVVLSRNEINKIIHSIKNPKHKLLLTLSYGAGLRVSETVNLKVKDINLEELTIHLKQAKGKKDRLTIYPEKLKTAIIKLMAGKDKNNFVFESERGGKLTTRTAQKVFRNSLNKSGVKKEATFHSLRHSFATHLLENGVDVRYVQELLGHQNIRTTQRYTQVTNPKLKNIKSPLQ